MDILAFDIVRLWSRYVWPILLFVLGLGLMVFVHELGHFLVAKWVGIKVERFALGLGPRVLGFRKGETDYCFCAFPFGGYVKMLGQEDFKPLKENEKPDPRSYQGKSVGARFAVISAGVIMNLILAAVLFIIIGLIGKDFPAPVAGGAGPGDPASQARIVWQDGQEPTQSIGLENGDKILKIEGDSIVLWVCGNKIEHFQDIALTAALSDPANTYTFTVEREIDGKKRIGKTELKVKASNGMFLFGIILPWDIVFDELEEDLVNTPFLKNDRIIAIDGENIEQSRQIDEIEKRLTGKPVTVTVLRKNETVEIHVQPYLSAAENFHLLKDGTIVRGEVIDRNLIKVKRPDPEKKGEMKDVKLNEFTVRLADGGTRKILLDELDTGPLRILGMAPPLRVLTVAEDSPAHKAGIMPGDVIGAYDGEKTPTNEQIREINKRIKADGAEITVIRNGQEKKFTVKPKKRKDGFLIGISSVPDQTSPFVAAVIPGTPAQKAGIPPESLITAVNGVKVASWIEVYDALKELSGKKVTITYRHDGQEKNAEIAKLDESVFRSDDYRFRIFYPDVAFKPLMVKIKQDGVVDSLAWGGRVTAKLVLASYMSIRSLIRGWASLEHAAGPVGIGNIAVRVARKSFMDFLYFLGFISAAIAVFNFLPFPVVDGGHAVFLIIEKIRGKPLPIKVMNHVQTIGLVMLLGLFLVITWNDIMRLLESLW